jgi:ABC-type sugar transport system permease subunit
MAILGLVPTVAAINLALKNRVLRYPDSEYVWLRNFIRLFSDRRFLNSIEVSAIWEIVTVVGAVAVGVLIAIYLFEQIHGRMRSIVSLLLIVPVLLPRVSAAFIWKFMYSPLTGILSWFLGLLGVENTAFLSDPHLALYAVARNAAARTARGRPAGLCAHVASLRVYRAADAEGADHEPGVHQDGRVAAIVRSRLRDDQRRPRNHD